MKSPVQCRSHGKSSLQPKTDRYGAGHLSWIDDVASCPVYRPTVEEFSDPLQYIDSIASEAAKYGMCKIVSPLAISVPAGVVLSKERSGFRFTSRIQPMRLPEWTDTDKVTFALNGRNYTFSSFEKMANTIYSRRFSSTASVPARLIEAEFWTELTSGKIQTVEYASDVEGSAFSTSHTDKLAQSKWNLKEFSGLPKSPLRHLDSVPGVTEPMLYIGMLFSMFAWHVEDHYLYSINYHHCGAAKTWYGVPGNAAAEFENTVAEHVYSSMKLEGGATDAAFDLLSGKTTVFPPKLLYEHGIPVFRTVQSPGEFVITFPQAYHAGFSHGFNCGEAVNFAMAEWFPFGAAACQRYKLLSHIPLFSHEEILCKEAMALFSNSSKTPKPSGSSQHGCVKDAFLSLMQFHLQSRSFLEHQGAHLVISNADNVHCATCQHLCYISYTSCRCSPEPRCFNHSKEFISCPCGGKRTLSVRDNFKDLEAIVHLLKLEDGCSTLVDRSPHDGVCPENNWQVKEHTKPQSRNGYCSQGVHAFGSENDVPNSEPRNPEWCHAVVRVQEDNGEAVKLKRQRIPKPSQLGGPVRSLPEIQLSAIRSKEEEIKVGQSGISGINFHDVKKGYQVTHLTEICAVSLVITDIVKNGDGAFSSVAADEIQLLQCMNPNATDKGRVTDEVEALRRNSGGGGNNTVQCQHEVNTVATLESGSKKGYTINLGQESKMTLPTLESGVLLQPEDKVPHQALNVLKQTSDHLEVRAEVLAGSNQDTQHSLAGYDEACCLPHLKLAHAPPTASEACCNAYSGQDNMGNYYEAGKWSQQSLSGDDLEEGELKEPISLSHHKNSTSKSDTESDGYHSSCWVKGKAFSPSDFHGVEKEAPVTDVMQAESADNAEQKLWQAEDLEITVGNIQKHDRIENRIKYHPLKPMLPPWEFSNRWQDMRSHSQSFPDNFLTSSVQGGIIRHEHNVPFNFSSERQDQESKRARWSYGRNMKTIALNNADRKQNERSCSSHSCILPSAPQRNSSPHFNDKTHSRRGTFRSKSFRHHQHHHLNKVMSSHCHSNSWLLHKCKHPHMLPRWRSQF